LHGRRSDSSKRPGGCSRFTWVREVASNRELKMGVFCQSLVVCMLVLVGTAHSQPVQAPAGAPKSAVAPAPAPLATTPVPTPAVTGPPSYVAINCGGLTPENASIPQYYGGVEYGYGTFYQPNNTLVSTRGGGNGAIVFQSDRFYYGTSTKPRQYLDFAPLNTVDGALYLTERYGLNFG
jgi:hypothetical protein